MPHLPTTKSNTTDVIHLSLATSLKAAQEGLKTSLLHAIKV
jgi:hypothetical protein